MASALFLFLAASYGLAWALSLSHIGAPYRWLGDKLGGPLRILVHCTACTAFWVGLALSFFWHSPALACAPVSGYKIWVAHGVDGLAACGVTWVVHVVLVKLGQNEL